MGERHGRYYHCLECAFSAGHATYCPFYAAWAERVRENVPATDE